MSFILKSISRDRSTVPSFFFGSGDDFLMPVSTASSNAGNAAALDLADRHDFAGRQLLDVEVRRRIARTSVPPAYDVLLLTLARIAGLVAGVAARRASTFGGRAAGAAAGAGQHALHLGVALLGQLGLFGASRPSPWPAFRPFAFSASFFFVGFVLQLLLFRPFCRPARAPSSRPLPAPSCSASASAFFAPSLLRFGALALAFFFALFFRRCLLQFFLALLLALERDVRRLRARRGSSTGGGGGGRRGRRGRRRRLRAARLPAAAAGGGRGRLGLHVPDFRLDRHRLVVLPAHADHQEGQQQARARPPPGRSTASGSVRAARW